MTPCANIEAYLDRRLETSERVRFEEHLADCSACSRMVEESERTLIRELEELRELHHARLDEVKHELEDQRKDLIAAEQRKLRRELFDRAVAELEADLADGVSPAAQDRYVDDFAKVVEGSRT